MKLSVVIPVYNERKTIKESLKRVLAEKTPKEVLVVDDGSTDGTFNIVKSEKLKVTSRRDSLNGASEKLKIFHNERNMGKGAAVRKGISQATGDVLVIQDADLEYDPKYYKELIKPIISSRAKVVYGSRLNTMKLKLWGKDKTKLPLHYLVNRFLSFLTNVIYGSDLTDMETCYKTLSREVYQKLKLESNRFEIEPEITAKILKMGYKIFEVPITVKPRGYKEGKKIKTKDAFIAVWTLLKYRFSS